MLETLLEYIATSVFVILLISAVLAIYISQNRKKSKQIQQKIEKAKELGLYEPVSLHPVIDVDTCIGSGACVAACPEKDILGIVNGQAKVINASRCVGHGACYHACPVQAISLCIGTEKRGVELPHISSEFETNIPGIYIAGELGGMGLIKNAVEQGKQSIEFLSRKLSKSRSADYDVVIVGAGPAGISASLASQKNNLKYVTLEQDNLGGTVFNFPRAKIIMTSAMDLPLYGKVKLTETSKSELLSLWSEIIKKNNVKINELEKVDSVQKAEDHFIVKTSKKVYKSNAVLLATGRRGTPRKLGLPGETREKVYYRLLDPEMIKQKKILVIGGGDSAIESALLLSGEGNEVTISYRGNSFSRIKQKNLQNITEANKFGIIKILFNSNVKEILEEKIIIETVDAGIVELANDLIYIFAGGELPAEFLQKIGIKINKKFGEAILTHKRK